jgi:general secretion pathway protein D
MTRPLARFSTFLACFLLVMVWLTPQAVLAKTERPATPSRVAIDFNGVDIGVFIKFISEITGKNFVVDRRVKGKVTVISKTQISIDQAYRVFESVLEIHGFTAVKAGKIIKIIPAPDARAKSIETRLRAEADSPKDIIITQIIPLVYADANDVKRLFTPMISKSSVILAYPPTNNLIVTDVQSNIKRLLRILSAIDVPGIGRELTMLPLIHANAGKLVKMLAGMFRPQGKPKKGELQQNAKFVADERTNTVLVLASQNDTVRIKKLIALLDKAAPRDKGKIHVYYLENATAEDLAKVLQQLPQKKGVTAKSGKAPVISEKVNITADKATNSLIIMADQQDYAILEQIIKKLDVPRAMVYIESLIMEVNVDKTLELGVEWMAAGKTGDVGYGGGAGKGDLATGLATLASPTGFALGILGEGIAIGETVFPSIAAFVNAYQEDKDVHILSTPQVLTTDNEEATIIVGRNVPFQTQSAAQTGTDTYSSFEYKDVGITLKITPHISKDRLVRLKISQVVTQLDSTVASSGDDRPTTLKRSIDTTVIVNDKNTVVIGGLIDDSFTVTKRAVPCLGDIPLLGLAFRNLAKERGKTNLYVFLTPRVIENAAEAGQLYKKKKKQLDDIKEGHIKLYPGPNVKDPDTTQKKP